MFIGLFLIFIRFLILYLYIFFYFIDDIYFDNCIILISSKLSYDEDK